MGGQLPFWGDSTDIVSYSGCVHKGDLIPSPAVIAMTEIINPVAGHCIQCGHSD